ncbi:MAG: transketolase [Candidatus Izemoplasmatales bacterium]
MDFKEKAKEIRRSIINMIGHLGVGHIGGSLSIVDALVVLYYKHMRIDPRNPKLEGRDRCIISKGHSGPALYAVLADKGYFDKALLLTLNQPGTKLPSHCDMNLTPGVDMTTGSLAQGFSAAVGAAKASKIVGDGARIYTIIGDGESQEGQVWEAGMFAANAGLNNLIAFTDDNRCQIDGDTDAINRVEPLVDKWAAFGWNVIDVKDGHDVDAIDRAVVMAKRSRKRPTMIILHTIKGKGVSFIEAMGYPNHNFNISKEQVAAALKELE